MKQWQLISLLVLMSISILGCGGRTAKPITIYQDGDLDKSCEQLGLEMTELRQDARKLFTHTDKTLANALWGTAGAFFIVPYCGMDLKNAEKTEYEAIAKRHNYLLDIARYHGCQVDSGPIPSIEEYKTILKQSKKNENET